MNLIRKLLFILPLAIIITGASAQVAAQEAPLAHLTVRECLIPDTDDFRISFRADYEAGQYRIVGRDSGFILNVGDLELNETGGGFTESNTAFVLPTEDIWIKQWFNGERWQRSGGLFETDVEQFTELGFVCPNAGHLPYYSVTPTPTPTVTPTPTATPTPTTMPTATPIPTPPGQVLGAETGTVQQPQGRVLGAETLSPTGLDLPLVMQLAAVITGASAATVFKQFKKDD